MRDEEAEALIARIRPLGDKWPNPLGFGCWHVTHEYFREGTPPVDPSDLNTGESVLFRVTTDWEYMRVNIKVDLVGLRGLEDEELEMHYLHEWGHAFLSIVLTTPKGEARYRAVEHVATMLGKAFYWARDWGKGDAKKARKAKKKAKRAA